MAMVNQGEAYYMTGRKCGEAMAQRILTEVRQLPIQLVSATDDRVLSAATITMRRSLSYADAFAAATAIAWQATLLTGDPELFALEGLVRIERLERR